MYLYRLKTFLYICFWIDSFNNVILYRINLYFKNNSYAFCKLFESHQSECASLFTTVKLCGNSTRIVKVLFYTNTKVILVNSLVQTRGFRNPFTISYLNTKTVHNSNSTTLFTKTSTEAWFTNLNIFLYQSSEFGTTFLVLILYIKLYSGYKLHKER